MKKNLNLKAKNITSYNKLYNAKRVQFILNLK